MLMPERFSFHDLQPHLDSFLNEVLTGLARPQKEIPAKFFYDQRGCALFEQICDLPEYYPTRTETALMQAHAGDMARLLGEHCLLIEYGSGSSLKTRILLDVLHPAAYVPIDIAAEQLRQSVAAIAEAYPALKVIAVCADYTMPWQLPESGDYAALRKVVFFPGSTIGNFTPQETSDFLKNVAALVGEGGGMLVGVDLKKDAARLDAAYNDAQGITAAFNLNLLQRINRELGADFDVRSFRHHAFYNEREGRIEMHLASLKPQTVNIGGKRFVFHEGETIHTENSCKYAIDEFQALAVSAGFEPAKVWTDDDHLFAVHYLVA